MTKILGDPKLAKFLLGASVLPKVVGDTNAASPDEPQLKPPILAAKETEGGDGNKGEEEEEEEEEEKEGEEEDVKASFSSFLLEANKTAERAFVTVFFNEPGRTAKGVVISFYLFPLFSLISCTCSYCCYCCCC